MMINSESILYSLRNLMNRKSRSILTIFSIFLGITTIFVFVSFGLGLYSYVQEFTTESSADKVLILAKGIGSPGMDDTFSLTESDLDAVRNTNGVYEASGVYSKVAEVKQGDVNKFIFLTSYDPEKPLILESFGEGIGIRKGRLLKSGDEGKVVLGFNYLIEDKIFPKSFDINDKIEVQGKNLRIVGFMEPIGNPPDDSAVYIINDYIDEIFPNSSGNYTMLIARVNIKNIGNVVGNIEKNLRKSRDVEEGKEDFFVQSFNDLLETYSMVLNLIIGFVVLIAFISLIVSAINTANTMVTSTLERVKEVGIIKSIGAKNSEVFKIFLFESGFLGFAAGILGVGFGALIVYISSKALENLGFGFLSPSYSIFLFFGLILFATVTGAISGAWPAWQSSKVRPVEALRYE